MGGTVKLKILFLSSVPQLIGIRMRYVLLIGRFTASVQHGKHAVPYVLGHGCGIHQSYNFPTWRRVCRLAEIGYIQSRSVAMSLTT